MTAGQSADAEQAEMLAGSIQRRMEAQVAAVKKSSDALIVYMQAERAAAEATREAERLRVAAFWPDDTRDAFLPAWARGKFPFDRPKPTLRDRMPMLQQMLSSLCRSRDRWFNDGGNVGSESDSGRSTE